MLSCFVFVCSVLKLLYSVFMCSDSWIVCISSIVIALSTSRKHAKKNWHDQWDWEQDRLSLSHERERFYSSIMIRKFPIIFFILWSMNISFHLLCSMIHGWSEKQINKKHYKLEWKNNHKRKDHNFTDLYSEYCVYSGNGHVLISHSHITLEWKVSVLEKPILTWKKTLSLKLDIFYFYFQLSNGKF